MLGIEEGLVKILWLLPFVVGFLVFLRWLALEPTPGPGPHRRGPME